ncbi:MAG TPA: ATP-binding protein, partial [Euzebya sp.]|nr:ATP-binding protein [Euzebya sp.]
MQLRCPRTIGRDGELARLRQMLEGLAREGRGGGLVLVGEAGVGKTRIVHDAVAIAAGQGLEVAVGHASSRRARAWLAPFAEILLGVEAAIHTSEDPDLVRLWPVLAHLVPAPTDVVAAPDPSPALLAYAVRQALIGPAGGGLVVVEDAHDLSGDAVEVLRHL